MRLLTPGIDRADTGGGSTFLKNFKRAMTDLGHELTGNHLEPYDVLIIAGATLCDRAIVEAAIQNKKPIILRVDNILEDKKNRNGGMPKMIEYAKAADIIIYQSEWAKALLSPIIGQGVVIYNGVDTDIYYPKTYSPKEIHAPRTFFYSKFSRGEGKNVNVVQQWWREHSLHRPQDKLLLAGRFAEDNFQVNHPFEFHNKENFSYAGQIRTEEHMAEIMRECDAAILPYFADACSNTILEAQASGLYTIFDRSGGTPEIIYPGRGEEIKHDIHANKNDLIRRIDESRANQNHKRFTEAFGLEKMARGYQGIIAMATAKYHEI